MGGTTALQKQLAKLSSGHRQETRLRKVASFLFADNVAQEVSTSQCHQIGVRGLKGLAQLDSRFNHFFATLYDEGSLETERMMMTPQDAEGVDNSMDLFLWLMSPHFLLGCAHEASEFLLRHYEVHIVQTESVLRAIIPFHDHLFFARMVQLLPLRNTRWSFLWSLQRKGKPISRSLLVEHILDDPSIFTQICEWTTGAVQREADHPALLNLFNALVVELVANFQRKSRGAADRFVGQVLPVAEELISRGHSLDAQAAGHTALATIFATTPLSQQVCVKTLLKVAAVMTPSSDTRAVIPQEQVCKVAALIASQLPAGTRLSSRDSSKLLHVRWGDLAAHLEVLQHSSEGAALLALLLTDMVRDAVKSSGRRMGSLQTLLEKVDLTERQGAVVASGCLAAVAECADEQPIVATLLSLVESNCCRGFDAALRQHLESGTPEEKAKVFGWLKKRFAPTSDAPGQTVVAEGDEMYTVSIASMHPEARVRQMAAQQLVAGLTREGPGAAESGRLVLRMLDLEEDPLVLDVLLSEPCLAAHIDLEEALPVVSGLSLQHAEPVPTTVAPLVAALLSRIASRAFAERHASAAEFFVTLALFAARCSFSNTGKKGRARLQACQTLLSEDQAPSLRFLAAGMCGGLTDVVVAVRKAVAEAKDAIHAAVCRCLETAAARATAMRHRGETGMEAVESTALLCALFAGTIGGGAVSGGVFRTIRDHMHVVMEVPLVTSPNKDALLTSVATAATVTDRLKMTYLHVLSELVACKSAAAAEVEEAQLLPLMADCFELLALSSPDAYAAPVVQPLLASLVQRHSLSLVGQVWAQAPVSDVVLLKSFEVAQPALEGKVKNTASPQLSAAVLCLLTRKLSPAVLEALARLVALLAKNVGQGLGAFLKALGARLADVSVQSLPQLVADLASDEAVVQLCEGAAKWKMLDLPVALQDVVTPAKLRASLPAVSAALGSETLSAADGALAHDATRSLRAVYGLTASEWKKLPDRAAVHEAVCRCMEHVSPVHVDGRIDGRWRFSGTTLPATNLSFPDTIASFLIEESGEPTPGFRAIFEAYDHGERQRWLDALLALVSSGHAAGQRILRACQRIIGQSLRLHAALLAGRWSKSLLSKTPLQLEVAPEGGDADDDEDDDLQVLVGKKRKADTARSPQKRVRGDAELSLPLCRVVEALLVMHPAKGLPQPGQDPVGVATFVWRCLRVESAKPRSDRSAYLMSLFVSLLSNCAAEYAACAAKAQAEGQATDLGTVVPGITAKDRACDAMRPLEGNTLVDLTELVEVLKSVSSSSVRRDGMKVFRSLVAVNPSQVYSACLHFVVAAVGIAAVDDLLEEMLVNLIPGLLASSDGSSLVTLIHIVLYSYASRRGSSEAALDGCHRLLERCNVHFQLVALNKLLMLTIKDSPRTPEEDALLTSLGKYHPAALSPEQIELRVILFALRHLVSDTFIDAVLDEEDAQGEEPEYFESFTNMFLCLLRMYKQAGGDQVDEAADANPSEGDDSSMGSEAGAQESEDDEEEEGNDDDSSDLSDADKHADDGAAVDDLYNLSVPGLFRVKQMLVAVVDVMPIPVFVAAIQELLSESGVGLRTLGLRLFNSKLEALGDRLTHDDSLAFITMLPELKEVLDGSADALLGDAFSVQSALWTLEILTRHLAPLHPRSFAHFLPSITSVLTIFKQDVRLSKPDACAVASSAMLTLGHVCHEIEAVSLEHVPRVVPALLDVCNDVTEILSKLGLSRPKPAVRQLLESCCTSVTKVLRIGQFLSPYYSDIARIATSRGAVAVAPESAEKLLSALLKEGTRRLLFPSLTQALSVSSPEEHSHPMLWKGVAKLVEDVPASEVIATSEVVMKVVLASFKSYTAEGLAQLPVLKAMGDAITALSLKLDSKRLVAALGAVQQGVFAYDRTKPTLCDQRQFVAFCVLVSRLQVSLTSLFCPIFKMFLPQLCEMLEILKGLPGAGVMSTTASVLALRLLKQNIEDDTDMIVARSASLAQLVTTTTINQLSSKAHLERELVFDDEEVVGEATGYAGRVDALVSPILTRLGIDCDDRALWHKMQKAVLQVYRQSTSAPVRLATFAVVRALYSDIGQEYAAACVPEALQTLAEALDDDDIGVSRRAVDIIKLLSKLTGEDVAAYIK